MREINLVTKGKTIYSYNYHEQYTAASDEDIYRNVGGCRRRATGPEPWQQDQSRGNSAALCWPG